MKQYISYTRVSTSKQGLGLEAQTTTIESYVKNQRGIIIGCYSEKESGKETINRHELQKAIAQAKSENAILIVAKLDRLSRDIVDIFTLKKDSNLHFEVADMAASDTMTLGIFATLAQKERELISKRTKEALAARKAQGVKLGNPNAADTLRKYNHLGVEKRKAAANMSEANRHAYAAIRYMDGSLKAKADYLNENGFKTPNGNLWNPIQISRLIARYTS
jgi:DNA invertase Pin-like site-specific DNA recombinase